MQPLNWTDSGLVERQGDLQVCVWEPAIWATRAWLDRDYRAAVRAIASRPERYRLAIAVAVASTYAPTDPHSSYVVHLLRWSKACPSCAECGGQPAKKAAIGGIADWRCVVHEREARVGEQKDIDRAIAKGATWLKADEEASEPEQASMFELLEAA